jgi:hypothetical protein
MLLHAPASLPRTQRASDSGTLHLSLRFCNFLQLFGPALQTQLGRERTLALCRPMREGDDERSCRFSLEGCQSRRCPPSSAADNAAAADAHRRGDGYTWRHARYRSLQASASRYQGVIRAGARPRRYGFLVVPFTRLLRARLSSILTQLMPNRSRSPTSTVLLGCPTPTGWLRKPIPKLVRCCGYPS